MLNKPLSTLVNKIRHRINELFEVEALKANVFAQSKMLVILQIRCSLDGKINDLTKIRIGDNCISMATIIDTCEDTVVELLLCFSLSSLLRQFHLGLRDFAKLKHCCSFSFLDSKS